MSDALLKLDGLVKTFGSVVAVDEVSFEVARGEFFALLGPSGCGKTSLMRLIAGFEAPDRGRVFLNGKDITAAAPYERPVNMMFQSYALFPHLTVERNVAFGLVQAGLPKPAIAQRVGEMLDLVQLRAKAGRKPHQLSGGERQRVALARALARRPKLLLLDEPLAALDRKLREETQFELMRIQRETGATFLVVTHDQDEAMGMAQRIAVMRAGKIVQMGAPQAIYDRPASRFVAGFLGKVNLFDAKVVSVADGRAMLALAMGDIVETPNEELSVGDVATLAIRPEDIVLSPASAGASAAGEVVDIAFLGDRTVMRVRLDSGQVAHAVQIRQREAGFSRGARVGLSFAPDAARVLRE